jgi:hypothetical protein
MCQYACGCPSLLVVEVGEDGEDAALAACVGGGAEHIATASGQVSYTTRVGTRHATYH